MEIEFTRLNKKDRKTWPPFLKRVEIVYKSTLTNKDGEPIFLHTFAVRECENKMTFIAQARAQKACMLRMKDVVSWRDTEVRNIRGCKNF